MRRIAVLLVCTLWQGIPLLAAETAMAQDVFHKMCSRCHKLPQAATRTPAQWQIIVEVMQKIMLQRGIATLSDEQTQQVLSYLQQNGARASEKGSSESRDMFMARCALCHQLPEPTMLKPVQWKLIIQTMQQRMRQVGVPQLNDEEYQQIMHYLQSQSSQ